jgi:hypothetical protein
MFNYLKKKKKKCLFSKMKNRKVKQVLSGVGSRGRREDIKKGCRRVNIM